MKASIEGVTTAIRDVAATEILPRFRSLTTDDITEKTGPRDLVTAADLASESALSRRLSAMEPGSLVVGEEATGRDPALLERLTGNDPVWIIDPLDGTLNFTEGRCDFTVIVAHVRRGRTVAGWIYRPADQTMVTAESGAGAWHAGDRLRTATPVGLDVMRAALYVGKRRAPALYQRIKDIEAALGPRSHARCAGIEYLKLAMGELHYAIFTQLRPWDHAAGCLIHTEAGGHLACLDGRPYRPAPIEGSLLIAPDAASWQWLRDVFSGAAIPGG